MRAAQRLICRNGRILVGSVTLMAPSLNRQDNFQTGKFSSQLRWMSTGGPDSTKSDNKASPLDEAIDDMVDETEQTEKTETQSDPKLIVTETETVKGDSQNFGFQAETRQLLDIVARSLYTEKEIFIRELISNASDALEKRRHLSLVSQELVETNEESTILLTVDEKKRTFSLQDNGIGMTKDELIQNLGTIARSGSKAFLQKLKEDKSSNSDVAESIIGQFGVGFYSAFMCAKGVKVYSRSCYKNSTGYLWESDGSGEFTIKEAEGVAIGTKIIIQLKETESQFASQSVVERIIRKYSNFIGFPIYLNAKRVNTVDAIWRKDIKKVTEEDHEAFYKFISSDWQKPLYRLHYKVDAPVNINAIFYIGHTHNEKFGVARLEPNVSLYCKKVLIKHKAKDILPEWMRFIHGVVDSEDLPLNISREGTQDSSQIRKLNNVLTRRLLKWMEDEAKKDPVQYEKFFLEFGSFLKEGVCTDQLNKAEIGKLLRFESSQRAKGELVSLDEYIERMPEGQEKIYFLHTPSRETALSSPYYEQFKKKNVEVLFLSGNIDEYVMGHLATYKKHRLYSIENPDVDLDKIKSKANDESNQEVEKSMEDLVTKELDTKQCTKLSEWFTKVLGEKLMEAKPTKRLSDSPAVIVTGHEQASMHRMMKQMALMQGKSALDLLPKQVLEYNPKHVVIKKLYYLSLQKDNESVERGRILAEQIFDNALIAADLLGDPRNMLSRLNTLLVSALRDVPEKEVEEENNETEQPSPSKPE